MKLTRNAPPALALDFAPQRRRAGWIGWLLLALGVTAAATAVVDANALRRELDERAAIVDRLRAQLRPGGAPAASAASAAGSDPAAMQAVAAQLRADWGRMLADLAQAQGAELTVLEIHGDAGRGTLRLVADAPALEDAFAYVERLQQQAGVRGVAIDSHAWVDIDGMARLRFTVSGRWGDTP